jgi:hypothetical protein
VHAWAAENSSLEKAFVAQILLCFQDHKGRTLLEVGH